MQLSFDAVFYYTSDLDRAIRFYRETLGLRLTSRDYVARFDIDGVLFELVPGPPEKISGHGNARLCLRTDNIQNVSDQLRAKGVAVSAIDKKANGLLAEFKDPDGNEVCLWQYT